MFTEDVKQQINNNNNPLNREGVIYCNDDEKSNILNTYFIEQNIVDEDNATLPQTIPLPNYKLDFISVTPDEVQSTIQTLQLGKSAGPDSINNRLLKELAQPLSFPLSDIFNCSLSTDKLPSICKLANVTPIYKKDDPSDVSKLWTYLSFKYYRQSPRKNSA